VVIHRHSHQWYHVRMVKDFPPQDLPAEPLQQSYGQFAKGGVRDAIMMTYEGNLTKVTVRVYL